MRALIAFCLSLSASHAFALEGSNPFVTHVYCLSIESSSHSPELPQVFKRVVTYLMETGLYLEHYRIEIDPHCGPASLRMDVSAHAALRIKRFLSHDPVVIRKIPKAKIHLPDTPEFRTRVEEAGNAIFKDMASAILAHKRSDTFQELVAKYLAWSATEWGAPRHRTFKLLSAEDRDAFQNELSALKWAAEQQANLRSSVAEIQAPRQPVLQMSVEELEELKNELPQIAEMLSHEQNRVSGASLPQRPWSFEKRIKFIDTQIGVGLYWIGSSTRFNTETYEALAAVLLETLDFLKRAKDESGCAIVDENSLSDVLNRKLAIWRHLHLVQFDETDLGLRLDEKMQLLLTRLSQVRGLAPFFRVYLTALVSDRNPDVSERPSKAILADYLEVTKSLPALFYSEESGEAQMPVWLYGDLDGKTVIPIASSLKFIRSWLLRHGYKKYRYEWEYQTLEFVKQSLLKRRTQQSRARCERLLSGHLT